MHKAVGNNYSAAHLRCKEIIPHHKLSNWPIGTALLLYRPSDRDFILLPVGRSSRVARLCFVCGGSSVLGKKIRISIRPDVRRKLCAERLFP
jgi:hypothetical protein